MKNLNYLLLSFSLFIFTTQISAQKKSPVDDAKAMFEQALKEFNERNYEAYFSHIADDIEAYTGVVTPLRHEGKEAWMKFINGLANFKSASYDQRQPDYRAYGDNTVVCNAYFVFTSVSQDGVVESQNGRETTVLAKIDGKWKIANYHFSRIF